MASKLTPAQRVALARHPERPARQISSSTCLPISLSSGATACAPRTAASWAALPVPRQAGDRHRPPEGPLPGGEPVPPLRHALTRGYRKAQRLMLQAEKFRRPVITFIDTPGATRPGARGPGPGGGHRPHPGPVQPSHRAIVSVVTGEGGSGGALALGVGNRVLMLENAVYSVLSPEALPPSCGRTPPAATRPAA